MLEIGKLKKSGFGKIRLFERSCSENLLESWTVEKSGVERSTCWKNRYWKDLGKLKQ
jgi:hypothetical protein